MAVRALAFDVFGTLVDWRSGIAGAFRSSGTPGDPEQLADAWRERYLPIMLEVNAGRRPWGNFDELHLATLDDLLNERGLVDLTRHGDLRFDCLLSAELAHAYKPAPEVYLTAARLLCLDPSELMMVAAHPRDLQAARRAGLRSAFIERPLEHGPGSLSRADPDADESVLDLQELAARLQEPG